MRRLRRSTGLARIAWAMMCFRARFFGAQAALQVVFVATLLSLVVGVPLGLLSGYRGGWLDRGLLFLMDTIYTLPGLLLAITVAFVVGKGVLNAAIALSVAYIPQYYRVVRNHTVSLKNEVFIEAARALGASTPRILQRYLLVNVLPSIPVLFTLNAADAILTLAGLGVFGLRVAAPSARMGARSATSFRWAVGGHLVDDVLSGASHDTSCGGSIASWRRARRAP